MPRPQHPWPIHYTMRYPAQCIQCNTLCSCEVVSWPHKLTSSLPSLFTSTLLKTDRATRRNIQLKGFKPIVLRCLKIQQARQATTCPPTIEINSDWRQQRAVAAECNASVSCSLRNKQLLRDRNASENDRLRVPVCSPRMQRHTMGMLLYMLQEHT
jgi:hypothetical protein